jgi:hypothetical protein
VGPLVGARPLAQLEWPVALSGHTQSGSASSSSHGPPARADAPTVKHARRGGVERALDGLQSTGFPSLLDDLVGDRDANSGRGTQLILLRTWTRFHDAVFGNPLEEGYLPMLPASARTIAAVAAIFKKGDYRSFPNYLSALKQDYVERGHERGALLEHTAKWCSRSVLRGIGPSRQSHPLRLHSLMHLELSSDPVAFGGPCCPLSMTLLGCIFLLREIELSLSMTHHWTFDHELMYSKLSR